MAYVTPGMGVPLPVTLYLLAPTAASVVAIWAALRYGDFARHPVLTLLAWIAIIRLLVLWALKWLFVLWLGTALSTDSGRKAPEQPAGAPPA